LRATDHALVRPSHQRACSLFNAERSVENTGQTE
jgi:hypothetical protein